jgi:streptomycin 6-kinase
MVAIQIPATLREAGSAAGRGEWLARLPDLVHAAQERWSLVIGEPFEPGGQCAWVAPARRAGEEVVVKIGWPHPESEDEAAGLALWASDGAVALLDAATLGDSQVLLLERCLPGESLTQRRAPAERDVVVAGLLRRLWRPPPSGHAFRPLQQMCVEWADDAEQRLGSAALVDRGLIAAGLTLFRSLPQSAATQVVLFTDLHGDNVLAASREPWLAIDPKPYVGDPTYDVLQHMLNVPQLVHDPQALVDRMAALAELDPAGLRLWTFARCALLAVDDPAYEPIAARIAP